jgi:hypothetical protein
MSKINNVRLPNAAPREYSPDQFNQLVRSLEQIILQLNSTYTTTAGDNVNQGMSFYEGGGGNAAVNVGQNTLLPYGSFYDTTTQVPAVINTAYAITFNTTAAANATYLGSPTSRVYVDVSTTLSSRCRLTRQQARRGTSGYGPGSMAQTSLTAPHGSRSKALQPKLSQRGTFCWNSTEATTSSSCGLWTMTAFTSKQSLLRPFALRSRRPS